MSRMSLNTYIVIGLLFWGLPAVFVAGPQVILYACAAVVPVWLLRFRGSPQSDSPRRPEEVLVGGWC